MKNFFASFLGCLLLCFIVAFFFGGLLMSNIWAILILVALFLAILITAFLSQDARMEELEKKISQLTEDKQE